MNIPGKMVVRTYAPARRWVLLSAAVLLTTAALFLIFELGLRKAGFDAIASTKERDELQQQIDQLQRTERELRVQLAAADEARVAQIRERTEVARTIGELQAQVARQQQDIEFYRGMMPQQGPAAIGVRVQQFHIAATATAQKFVLHFTLNRPVRPDETINGTLSVTIDGTRNASAASANLAALTGSKSDVLPFNFRYYAGIAQEITLPADFKPERVTIELRPARKGMAPYRQTFVWSVDPT